MKNKTDDVIYKFDGFKELQNICWTVIIEANPNYRICDFINFIMYLWNTHNWKGHVISKKYIIGISANFKNTFMWDRTRDSYIKLLNS